MADAPALPLAARPGAGQSPWARGLRRLGSSRRGLVGTIVLAVLAAVALAAPLAAPFNPTKASLKTAKQPPSWEHPFGTDGLGRDVLSRVIFGARVSLSVAVAAVALAVALGAVAGMAAGFFGGWLDELLMRSADVLLAFPSVVLAIAIVAVLGPSRANTVFAVAVVLLPAYARLARAATLSVKATEYLEAARCLGAGPARLLARHVGPNIVSVIVVQASLDIGGVMLTEAGLSFLGLGVQPPTPSWGGMLSDGRKYLYTSPHIAVFPGLAIVLAVLACNLLGDGLRDALDPYLPRKA